MIRLSTYYARFFLVLMVVAFAAWALSPGLAHAQEGSGTGEVRRLDPDAGKITLKHGPISDLDLPAMTLVYLIEPVLLEGLSPGDSVRFTARRSETGEYLIIRIKKR